MDNFIKEFIKFAKRNDIVPFDKGLIESLVKDIREIPNMEHYNWNYLNSFYDYFLDIFINSFLKVILEEKIESLYWLFDFVLEKIGDIVYSDCHPSITFFLENSNSLPEINENSAKKLTILSIRYNDVENFDLFEKKFSDKSYKKAFPCSVSKEMKEKIIVRFDNIPVDKDGSPLIFLCSKESSLNNISKQKKFLILSKRLEKYQEINQEKDFISDILKISHVGKPGPCDREIVKRLGIILDELNIISITQETVPVLNDCYEYLLYKFFYHDLPYKEIINTRLEELKNSQHNSLSSFK